MSLLPKTQVSARCGWRAPPVPGPSPGVGLVGMGPVHPPHGLEEHPVVQAAEGAGRDADAEVVGPAPDLGVEGRQDRRDVGAHLALPDVPEVPAHLRDGRLAGRDEQLVPSFGARGGVVPHGEAQEVEALGEVDDAGLLLREGQPALGQPRREHADDRSASSLGLAEHDEVVGVADDGAVPLDAAGARALDAEGGLHAVEGDVGEEGADDGALPGAGVGGMEDAVVQVARLEPLLDERPAREGPDAPPAGTRD